MTEAVAYISPGTPIYRVQFSNWRGLRCAKYTAATSEAEAIANVRHENSDGNDFEAMRTDHVTK